MTNRGLENGRRIVRRYFGATAAIILCMALAGCQTDGHDSVVDKVMSDFGLRERPEGYESGSDRVFAKLPDVAKTEIRRLNAEARRGQVKFEQEGMRGMYYREVKVYEDYYPLDARALPRTAQGERGYNGLIEYSYRVFQSARKPSRVEAESAPADIPTGDAGRETYRYRFTTTGNWDGARGDRTRN